MAEQEYEPTEADTWEGGAGLVLPDEAGLAAAFARGICATPADKDAYSKSLDIARRGIEEIKAEVRADERAKIEEERRREHAEASAQRVPPIVEMADGFVGSTKIDRLGIELMRVWGRVDKTSSVSQHPLGYVATFADMARAVLDWPELADERAKRPDREQIDRIQFEIDNVHQIHGDTCLCGFKSSRSRSRTEHLTALFADAVLALEPETDQELQDRIEVLEKNLAYEVAQKIKLAEQLQAATTTSLTLEQARWKMHAGIDSRCSEEVAAKAKPVIDLVLSSLALEPEAREEPKLSGILARAEEVRQDDGWGIGGAWGDYGEAVVPLRILSYVIEGELDQKVASTDPGFALTYAEQVRRAEEAEAKLAEAREEAGPALRIDDDGAHIYWADPVEGCWVAFKRVDCVGEEELPERRLPAPEAREIPDAEVAAAYSAFVQASFGFPGAPAMRAALEAAREVSRG